MANQSGEECQTWREILIGIATEYAKDLTIERFIVQNKDKSYGLIVDVLGFKVSPLSLIHKSFLKKPDTTLKDADVDTFPLLSVRYNHTTKAMLANPVIQNDIVAELRIEKKTGNFIASTQAILDALAHLQQKELVLSPPYVTRFGKENNTRVFRPSFLVPMAIEEAEMKKEEGCCSLAGCSNPGWAICAKCKSAQYCSREHQVEHWKKAHKNVCGKTHEEIAAATAAKPSAKDPPSVVIPMRSLGDVHGMSGMYNMSMSLNSGKTRTTGPQDIDRNIHGDKKFLIKVQQVGVDQSSFPPRASRQGAMSIYDETRSFHALFGGAHGYESSNLSAQIAYRFPELTNPELRTDNRDAIAESTAWHTDGLRQGKAHGFSLLLGIVLSDVHEDFSGNLMVWPGSHLLLHSCKTTEFGALDMVKLHDSMQQERFSDFKASSETVVKTVKHTAQTLANTTGNSTSSPEEIVHINEPELPSL
eukprot:gene26107-32637_t